MNAPIRSWLYVPADRPERVAKALVSAADAIVIDLEDAVAAPAKEAARATAVAAVSAPHDKQVWVRVNDLSSPWGADDLTALAGTAAAGVRLPKCEDPDAIHRAAELSGMPLYLLIESAVGLERATELARAHPAVVGIALGEADLCADLGITDEGALAYARGKIVAVARAARLPSPPQSVFTDVHDRDGLRTSTERARAAGFFGRSVVHPDQIPIVNTVFTPSAEEVSAARALLAALDAAEAEGRATLLTSEGRFVDPAVAAAAHRVVAIAAAITTPAGHEIAERGES
ncbi:MAG: CoA ester lyase [Protaetiibacter sp.]